MSFSYNLTGIGELSSKKLPVNVTVTLNKSVRKGQPVSVALANDGVVQVIGENEEEVLTVPPLEALLNENIIGIQAVRTAIISGINAELLEKLSTKN